MAWLSASVQSVNVSGLPSLSMAPPNAWPKVPPVPPIAWLPSIVLPVNVTVVPASTNRPPPLALPPPKIKLPTGVPPIALLSLKELSTTLRVEGPLIGLIW